MPAVECCQQNASITSFCTGFAREQNKKNKTKTKRNYYDFNTLILLCYVFCLGWSQCPDEVGKIWPYLRIRCYPCPRCLTWTGQTSADQGWCCAQRVSATEHTSVLRKYTGTANMHSRAQACKWLVSAAVCFPWFLLLHLFINKCWQNNIIALGIIVSGHQPAL